MNRDAMIEALARVISVTILGKTATRGGMDAAADVADIINRPALSFTDHQHFILPGLRSLGQFDAQGNVSRIGVGNGRSAGHFRTVRQRGTAGERIGFKQGIMLRIAGGVVEQFCQTVAQVRAQAGEIVAAVLNAVIIELLRHGVRAAVNAGAAAGTNILKGWRDRGGTGAEHQRAGH